MAILVQAYLNKIYIIGMPGCGLELVRYSAIMIAWFFAVDMMFGFSDTVVVVYSNLLLSFSSSLNLNSEDNASLFLNYLLQHYVETSLCYIGDL